MARATMRCNGKRMLPLRIAADVDLDQAARIVSHALWWGNASKAILVAPDLQLATGRVGLLAYMRRQIFECGIYQATLWGCDAEDESPHRDAIRERAYDIVRLHFTDLWK